MSDGKPQFCHDEDGNRFVAEIGGERVGQIDYLTDGEVYDITHTETDPTRQGQGIAGGMTRFALDTVRSQGLTVHASCPYTANWIQGHPDYADLLAR